MVLHAGIAGHRTTVSVYWSVDLLSVRMKNIMPEYRGGGGDRSPLKPTKVTLFHHDFVQLGKQHSRYKAILPTIVFS